MSNPTRYDFTHPQCAGWDCCGGGRIDQDDTGAFVAFEDYAALQVQLAAVEAERDQMESMYRHHVAIALDAIAKLNHAQAILAALREPSEAVKIAVQEAVEREALAPCYYREAEQIVRAAVAAAEQEVSPAHGLTKRVLDVVQSGERGEPLPPIREAMDALMKEASDDPR